MSKRTETKNSFHTSSSQVSNQDHLVVYNAHKKLRKTSNKSSSFDF